MASAKIILRKDKINSRDEHPLYIRIIRSRKAIYSSLDIFLKEDQWDEKKQSIKKHPEAARLNAYIRKKFNDALLFTLEKQDSNKTLKELLKGKTSNRHEANNNGTTFIGRVNRDRIHDHCVPKYRNPSYPNRVNLFQSVSTCNPPTCYVLEDAVCPANPCWGDPCNPELKKVKPEDELMPTASPNPAYDYIEIQNIINGDDIKILDILGNIIFSKISAASEERIGLESIPAGIYFIFINEKSTTKFIKVQ